MNIKSTGTIAWMCYQTILIVLREAIWRYLTRLEGRADANLDGCQNMSFFAVLKKCGGNLELSQNH